VSHNFRKENKYAHKITNLRIYSKSGLIC